MGRASRGKKDIREAGRTRDHTVPQMYLRNFAEHCGRRNYELIARRIANVDETFPVAPNNILLERGFYWGATSDGIPHHLAEELLTTLETAAAPVMKALLNAPEGALPAQWPLPSRERIILAWWMAAQILRTTRQRKRLEHVSNGDRLEVPHELAVFVANNPHVEYIAENLSPLAHILYSRPWGLAFTDMCLLTSDVPVVLFNGHDADDQLAAADFYNIMLPLDPHRLIFMPNRTLQADDPNKRVDHRMKISGAVGIALVQVAYDVADALVIHHPQHNPWRHWKPSGPRQPTPWDGKDHPAPMYALEYPTLPPHLTVERRWLTEHPPPSATNGSRPATTQTPAPTTAAVAQPSRTATSDATTETSSPLPMP